MSNIVVAAIPQNLVAVIWPSVVDMIKVAVAESNEEICMSTMRDDIVAGRVLLVTIADDGVIICAFTLDIRTFATGKKVLNLCTVGGEGFHRWWDEIERAFMELAKEKDCDEIYVIGRPGWQKLLCAKGFDLIHTVLSRKVGEV